MNMAAGLIDAADLAHGLQRSRAYLIVRRRRRKVVEGFDVAAHGGAPELIRKNTSGLFGFHNMSNIWQ